ncbi:MAG: beta-ketoacyl synthase chain length factor [Methylococcales bacterium]
MTTRFSVKGWAVCCPDPEPFKTFGLDAMNVNKSLLPTSLRRRASLTTQMAITAATGACEQAGTEPRELASVFASVGGEIRVTDELCLAVADSTQSLSPTRFHNSVHNTTAGYWGILHECRLPAVAIAALEDTFAIALLEACSQLLEYSDDILLVCYDEFWPQYLAPPMGSTAFASALVLGTEPGDRPPAWISLPYIDSGAPVLNKQLEELIRAAPVSASIPLLVALNRKNPTTRVPLSPGPHAWYTDLAAP